MKKISIIILSSFISLVSYSQCADSLFITGHTIDAGVDGYTYQWYKDCSAMVGGMTLIPGATNRTYTPTDYTTDYSVMLTDPTVACTSISPCVSIDTNCRAYFYPTQTTPGQVVLVDSSYGMGTAIGYTWNFGDGNISYTQFPTHSYAAAGSYQVSLYIHDTLSGCSNFYHDTITVDSSGILRSGFTVTVISHNSVGIDELNVETELNVYPNPASNRVNLSFSETQENGTVELLDLNGKLIISKSLSGLIYLEIDSHNLESGIYLIRVNNEKGHTTKKLIIE